MNFGSRLLTLLASQPVRHYELVLYWLAACVGPSHQPSQAAGGPAAAPCLLCPLPLCPCVKLVEDSVAHGVVAQCPCVKLVEDSVAHGVVAQDAQLGRPQPRCTLRWAYGLGSPLCESGAQAVDRWTRRGSS
eukprot:COSAG01_NODE_3791_length_5691_cov_336.465486_6_plen_132_part_00